MKRPVFLILRITERDMITNVQGGREVAVHPDNTHLRLRPTLKAEGS
jgi:hypothetical protein